MAISCDDMAAAGGDFPEPFQLRVLNEAASTNDEARRLAGSGAPHGLVVLAERQTAGRGRRGAVWFSEEGASLAFSILLRPQEPKALWPRLALATGLAAAEAVEEFGLAAGIKWPNDVWVGTRKIAGILVEAADDCAIVGIGVNVNTGEFPPEVAEIATSLRRETGRELSRQDVLGALVRRFAVRHRQIGADFADVIDAVRSRCVLAGHRVSFLTAFGARIGRVVGIAPGGELRVDAGAGVENLLQADEIRILDADG